MSGRTVWLASYPKSGNTWLRAVYTALRNGTAFDINALDASRAPHSRMLFCTALGVRSSDLTEDETESLRPRADEALIEPLTEDTWRKTHDAYFTGPTGDAVLSARATRSALYVVRDPRDVAVSFAHHAGMSIEAAVDAMCSSTAALAGTSWSLASQLRQRLGTWSEHVTSWTQEAPFPVYTLRYEHCLADPVGTFRAAFMAAGLEVSEDEMVRAVEQTALDRLQAQEAEKGFRERPGQGSPFFRRGTAGGWKQDLPENLAKRLVETNAEVMSRFGYL